MKKKTLNEEIVRLRKIMGLNEEYDFEKSAIESASGDKVVQREFDDFDRPLYFSINDDNISYVIGDGKNGKVILKYNAKTGETESIGDLENYDSPPRPKDDLDSDLFEMDGEYDKSNGSPYDRGASDSYYRRAKDPHKYPEGTYIGEKITDLTPEELKAYEAGYEDNERSGDFKDWGED